MEQVSRGQESSVAPFSVVFYYLLAGIILLVAVFLFVTPASAATVEGEAVTATVSREADADNRVTAADLGVIPGTVLPDSPWYGFKRFGRNVQEAFTLNPVDKAELKLHHANQELVDASRLLSQKKLNSGAAQAAQETLIEFRAKIRGLETEASALKGQAGSDDRVDRFLDKVLDTHIKQQKVFANLEDRLLHSAPENFPPEMIRHLQAARNESAEQASQTLVAISENDKAEIAKRLERVFAEQSGSAFKTLRNAEVLQGLHAKLPEEARDALRQAEANAFKRFGTALEELPTEERATRFAAYAEHMKGNEVDRLQVFDRLKSLDNLPADIAERIGAAKDATAKQFQTRLEAVNKFDDATLRTELKEQAFGNIKEGDVNIDKLRVLQELKERVQSKNEQLQKDIAQQHAAGLDKFKAAFPEVGADADRFQELSKQMAERPDPVTFRLIQELEAKVKADPKKQAFIEQIQQEAKAKFAEQFQKEGDGFLKEITSSNPGDAEIFKKLRQEFMRRPAEFTPSSSVGEDDRGESPMGPPSGLQKFFNKALDKQTDEIKKQAAEMKKMFEARDPAVEVNRATNERMTNPDERGPDPFAGACNGPAECEAYCQGHPEVAACARYDGEGSRRGPRPEPPFPPRDDSP